MYRLRQRWQAPADQPGLALHAKVERRHGVLHIDIRHFWHVLILIREHVLFARWRQWRGRHGYLGKRLPKLVGHLGIEAVLAILRFLLAVCSYLLLVQIGNLIREHVDGHAGVAGIAEGRGQCELVVVVFDDVMAARLPLYAIGRPDNINLQTILNAHVVLPTATCIP